MPETLPTKKKPPLMYAIQRKSDGKWSRGGAPSKWGSLPKTWGVGPFKNHLLMFKIDGYSISIERAENELKDGWYSWRSVQPSSFTRFKLLHDKLFPYFDCEVVEFTPITMEVVNRYPAEEWIWNNCYKPNYEKMGSYGDGRYLEKILEYCKVYGKEF